MYMYGDFLNNYLTIIIFFGVALLLSIGFIFLNFVFAPKNPDPEKLSAYECGFEPFEDSRLEFDVRFYLVAILFIVLLMLIGLDVSIVKDIKHCIFGLWAVSSVGRASRLHRGGQRFESFTAHQEWGCSSVG